ncbi:hypothetical protein [Parasedimentitalea maritima]|uniref:Uncharacterized protein n=1 Tax=Parasedimentitalea maritima TaxID=2578117 RepID=A0A6A4RGG9_9RHOB|nr:hypothetical protein [Zongyanglinia marina]KAE9628652.1 hypothetical protein GP644_15885 [Zongyanglinia marina]
MDDTLAGGIRVDAPRLADGFQEDVFQVDGGRAAGHQEGVTPGDVHLGDEHLGDEHQPMDGWKVVVLQMACWAQLQEVSQA